MIILGIGAEHNSSACLMINGKIVGVVQEERLTKVKNQCAFPLLAINELLKVHLNGDYKKVDCMVYGTKASDPYYSALDLYSNYSIDEQLNDMKEYWYKKYYSKNKINNLYWKKNIKIKRT